MTTTTLAEITKEARANSERWFPLVHDPEQAAVPLALHYTLGLCGEVGEVANLTKKALRKGGPPALDDLGDELADVFIYLLLLADESGIDMEAAYRRKRDFNEARWGPAVLTAPGVKAKCRKCDGCGRIANSDDGEAWTFWASLPPGSDLAVQVGLVAPVPCPVCGGEGEVPA